MLSDQGGSKINNAKLYNCLLFKEFDVSPITLSFNIFFYVR